MKCEICGRSAESNRCFLHKVKKPLAKTSKLSNNKSDVKGDSRQMQEFFLAIWKKRKHVSEVSGDKLIGEALSTYFHHIFEKSKYPQYAYDEDNIILLSTCEHDGVEKDMYKYEKINRKREMLRVKYNL